MNIIYLFHAFTTTGGVERIFMDKASHLVQMGHDVTLLTFDQGDAPSAYPIAPGIRHIDLNICFYKQFRYGLLKRAIILQHKERVFAQKLRQVTQQFKPDIMICVSYDLTAVNVMTRLKDSSKKIIEAHSARYYAERLHERNRGLLHRISLGWRNRLLHQCLKRADAFVALTQVDADDWGAVRETHVIPNLLTQYPDDIQSTPKRGKRVITAGRLTEQKGYDLLIPAWKIVNQKHPDWTLDVYGNGEDRAMLEQEVKRQGLSDAIVLHMPTKAIYEKYMESDFYVLSSRWEGFGLVLSEAMSCGIPCVAFDCPHGPSDIITDGEDGLLVENGNIEQLAQKICYLIEHEDIRREMGRKARENVKRYLPENIMPQWEALFKTLINKR